MEFTHVSDVDLDFYYALFENKIGYNAVEINLHPPIVANFGIMSKTGRVEAIKGSVNFGNQIDAYTPAVPEVFRKPKKIASMTEVDARPLPKSRGTAEVFDLGRISSASKNAYTLTELKKWYKAFSGQDLSKKLNRELLSDLVLQAYKSK